MTETSPQPSAAPIIIVGGGPVGMNVAMNLDQLGVRSILINDVRDARNFPKGGTQNCRTMEHYRRHGLARDIRKLGLPYDYPTTVGYFTRVTTWELARIRMPSEAEKAEFVEAAPPTMQTPEPILRCNQMYVETLVLKHLMTRTNVGLRFGWTCVDFTDHGDRVSVAIEEIATGRRETLTGAYLVGCDGGQSFVRRGLAVRYGGAPPLSLAYYGGPMVNSYLRVPNFYSVVNRDRFWHYWTVNAAVRTNLVALDGVDKFVLSSKLRTAEDKPDPYEIARQFRAAFGAKLDFEFLGHAPWVAGYAFVAERFAAGRVFLAGDAVHLFSPAGGFGMNTGVDDAANLGWKLAALVQGWGGPRLAASYEIERKPIATRNTLAGQNLARNIGNVPVGDAIEDDTPEGAAARAIAGGVLAKFGEEFASIGVQLGARYDDSPIVVSDGTAPPPDDPAIYVPSACPGGRAPHYRLSDRSSLFDRLGPGFSLLKLGKTRADTGAIEHAARERHVPLTLLAVPEDDARDLYQADFALIRPDQHVAWRGNRLPDDGVGLLARVTGW